MQWSGINILNLSKLGRLSPNGRNLSKVQKNCLESDWRSFDQCQSRCCLYPWYSSMDCRLTPHLVIDWRFWIQDCRSFRKNREFLGIHVEVLILHLTIVQEPKKLLRIYCNITVTFGYSLCPNLALML